MGLGIWYSIEYPSFEEGIRIVSELQRKAIQLPFEAVTGCFDDFEKNPACRLSKANSVLYPEADTYIELRPEKQWFFEASASGAEISLGVGDYKSSYNPQFYWKAYAKSRGDAKYHLLTLKMLSLAEELGAIVTIDDQIGFFESKNPNDLANPEVAKEMMLLL